MNRDRIMKMATWGAKPKYKAYWYRHPGQLAVVYVLSTAFAVYMTFEDEINDWIADRLEVDRFTNALTKIRTPNELLAAAESSS